PSLVSLAAPPQLTLVQAEATAVAARGRTAGANNGTLCSLCHGDFTILEEDSQQQQQHQCTSCLSLVCSNCISSNISSTSTPNLSRILSMYIPEGYEHHLPGDAVCSSCAVISK
ncbi:hypothetical protein GGI21_005296, partial [Coemansia aciculifera]